MTEQQREEINKILPYGYYIDDNDIMRVDKEKARRIKGYFDKHKAIKESKKLEPILSTEVYREYMIHRILEIQKQDQYTREELLKKSTNQLIDTLDDLIEIDITKEQTEMKSLNYLEEMKEKYTLSNEDLIDILSHIGYIARDNDIDDTITEDLINELK